MNVNKNVHRFLIIYIYIYYMSVIEFLKNIGTIELYIR